MLNAATDLESIDYDDRGVRGLSSLKYQSSCDPVALASVSLVLYTSVYCFDTIHDPTLALVLYSITWGEYDDLLCLMPYPILSFIRDGDASRACLSRSRGLLAMTTARHRIMRIYRVFEI